MNGIGNLVVKALELATLLVDPIADFADAVHARRAVKKLRDAEAKRNSQILNHYWREDRRKPW